MSISIKDIANKIAGGIVDHVTTGITRPLGSIVDTNLTDITTTIGSFVIQSVRGKFQRSITFSIKRGYEWMEEALYGILYQYNPIKNSSNLTLTNCKNVFGSDGSTLYYKLGDGMHTLKYRKWKIMLYIQSANVQVTSTRSEAFTDYTIITYDLDPEFPIIFEKDMIIYRNSLLKLKKDNPFVTVYRDYHETDGYTTWEKYLNIPKRRLNTIYLPKEQKKLLVDTINNFMTSKKFYNEHGIPHNLKILLFGPGSSGKGEPLSTLIPTPDGYKKMGDIKPGDKVFSADGSICNVTDIFPLGERDIYKVSFYDGRYTMCTEDHLWDVIYKSHGDYKHKVMDVKSIMNDDYIRIHEESDKNRIRYKYFIPALMGPIQYPHRDVPIHPYVLGAFIGNGCLRESKLRISCGTDEVPRIIERLSGIHQFQYRPTPFSYNFTDNNGIIIKTKDFFKDIPELIGKLSHEKFIPEIYLYNDTQSRIDLLRGLMDTDGSISYSKGRYSVSYSSCSKKLLEQIIELIRSLGYNASIHEDKRTEKYRNGFHGSLHFYVDNAFMRLMFSVSYKMMRASDAYLTDQHRHYSMIPIINIEYSHREEAQCIKVDHPSHLYITNQFIVTHNTSITKMIASEWNRNLFEITGGKNGKFIPNAITTNYDFMKDALMSISDIDKYPQLINETDMDIEKLSTTDNKEETMSMKQAFNNMINALDGITSPEDRIIVMTTNHIEKFSPIFLRPGRVDLIMEIGYITPEVFRKYTYDMYGVELPEDIRLNDDKLTIGKLQFDVVFAKLSADDFVKKYVK